MSSNLQVDFSQEVALIPFHQYGNNSWGPLHSNWWVTPRGPLRHSPCPQTEVGFEEEGKFQLHLEVEKRTFSWSGKSKMEVGSGQDKKNLPLKWKEIRAKLIQKRKKLLWKLLKTQRWQWRQTPLWLAPLTRTNPKVSRLSWWLGLSFPSETDPAWHTPKFNLIILGQTRLCDPSVKTGDDELYYEGAFCPPSYFQRSELANSGNNTPVIWLQTILPKKKWVVYK